MSNKIFDPEKLERLNNPERLKLFPVDEIIKLCDIKDPGTILDYGAGTALFSIQFAKRFPDTKILCCDISDIMINWVNTNVVPNHNNIETVKMDKKGLKNIDVNPVDFLFMVNLYHELDNHIEVLKECRKLLKPGSYIAISDWKKKKELPGPPYTIRFYENEIANHLKKAGFKDVRIKDGITENTLILAVS